MAKKKAKKTRTRFGHLYDLTKAEANEYVRDMAMEAKLLAKLFPHLLDSFDRDELPIKFLLKAGAGRARKRKAVKTRKK